MLVGFVQGVAGAAAGQRRQAVTEGMDMPEDTQIGFSGKGSGIFGSFATPARSARPPAQVHLLPYLCPVLFCYGLIALCPHLSSS